MVSVNALRPGAEALAGSGLWNQEEMEGRQPDHSWGQPSPSCEVSFLQRWGRTRTQGMGLAAYQERGSLRAGGIKKVEADGKGQQDMLENMQCHPE